MLNRSTPPAIYNAVDFDFVLPTCQQHVLSNGTQVYAVNGGSQDALLLELVFDAGNWFEEKNLVAALTNFLLKNGTTTKNAFTINEEFEYYGAFLNRNCYTETANITLHCLSKHLEQLLPSVADIISNSTFPEEELALTKNNHIQKLQVNLQKCDFVANRLIDEFLYGLQHPYGKYSSTVAYQNVTRDQILDFYAKHYKHGHCKVFIGGKLPPNYLAILDAVLGQLPFTPKAFVHPTHTVSTTAQRTHNIINDANGVQAAIRLAIPAVNRKHPQFTTLQVTNTVFGGYFGSRLMSNIREDKGYTYGIHSYIQNHLHETALVIASEVGREVATATTEEVYKEIHLLHNELVSEEELLLVKNYTLGNVLSSLDGPFGILNRWKGYILQGFTEEYFYKSIDTIKNITPETIQQTAKTYLQPENFYELTVV
ncbi:MAG: insulinase family protein [Bacteroidetes bacterium]|nr:MAG: insulinase family protein [Bacteroidota bacterium]TAF91432.1 MAG: insulinase family protein [Bacteroidota bacterium]